MRWTLLRRVGERSLKRTAKSCGPGPGAHQDPVGIFRRWRVFCCAFAPAQRRMVQPHRLSVQDELGKLRPDAPNLKGVSRWPVSV